LLKAETEMLEKLEKLKIRTHSKKKQIGRKGYDVQKLLVLKSSKEL
jgi:hypothetical protein